MNIHLIFEPIIFIFRRPDQKSTDYEPKGNAHVDLCNITKSVNYEN